MSMFKTGTARYSMHRADPPLHLLVRTDHNNWSTWCGGGPAMVANTITQRRCSRCLALARADLAEGDVAADESSDLDWYLSRTPVNPGALS